MDCSAVTRFMRAEIEARCGPTAPTLDDLVRPLAAKTFEPLQSSGNGSKDFCAGRALPRRARRAAADALRGGRGRGERAGAGFSSRFTILSLCRWRVRMISFVRALWRGSAGSRRTQRCASSRRPLPRPPLTRPSGQPARRSQRAGAARGGCRARTQAR